MRSNLMPNPINSKYKLEIKEREERRRRKMEKRRKEKKREPSEAGQCRRKTEGHKVSHLNEWTILICIYLYLCLSIIK